MDPIVTKIFRALGFSSFALNLVKPCDAQCSSCVRSVCFGLVFCMPVVAK